MPLNIVYEILNIKCVLAVCFPTNVLGLSMIVEAGAKCGNFLVECLINPSIAGGEGAKDTNGGNANIVQAHCHTWRSPRLNITVREFN